MITAHAAMSVRVTGTGGRAVGVRLAKKGSKAAKHEVIRASR